MHTCQTLHVSACSKVKRGPAVHATPTTVVIYWLLPFVNAGCSKRRDEGQRSCSCREDMGCSSSQLGKQNQAAASAPAHRQLSPSSRKCNHVDDKVNRYALDHASPHPTVNISLSIPSDIFEASRNGEVVC